MKSEGTDLNTRQERLARIAVRYGYDWTVDPDEATTLVIFAPGRCEPGHPRLVAYRGGATAARSAMNVATIDATGLKNLTHRQAYDRITERTL